MIALDLALGHGVIWSAASVLNTLAVQKGFEIFGQVTRAIIRQQTRTVPDPDMIKSSFLQGNFKSFLHIQRGHSWCEFPGQNVTRIVIQNGGQEILAPANDLEICEVGLP